MESNDFWFDKRVLFKHEMNDGVFFSHMRASKKQHMGFFQKKIKVEKTVWSKLIFYRLSFRCILHCTNVALHKKTFWALFQVAFIKQLFQKYKRALWTLLNKQFKILKVYAIRLHRYRDSKICVCVKDSVRVSIIDQGNCFHFGTYCNEIYSQRIDHIFNCVSKIIPGVKP